MEQLHQTTGLILNRLGDVLLLLGQLQSGQQASHIQLGEHSVRLGAIEQRTAVIYERVASQEGRVSRNTDRLDEIDRRQKSGDMPSLSIKEWLRLGAAAIILIGGFLLQLPLDKIAKALSALLKGG